MIFQFPESTRKSNSKTTNFISKISNPNSALLLNSKKNVTLKTEFVYNTDAFVFNSTLKKNNLKAFNKCKRIKMTKIIFIEKFGNKKNIVTIKLIKFKLIYAFYP